MVPLNMVPFTTARLPMAAASPRIGLLTSSVRAALRVSGKILAQPHRTV